MGTKHERHLNVSGRVRKTLKKKLGDLLAEGVSVSNACQSVGIARTTFYKWIVADKNFENSIEQSKLQRVHPVEDALYKSALEGNVTAQIFFLTNKAQAKWADKRAIVNNTIVNKVSQGAVAFPPEDIELQKKIKEAFLNRI